MRRAGAGLVVALLGAQAIPVGRTNPPIAGDVPAPGDIKVVLRRACYDCHSRETRWPWYSRVAPVSWLIASDVREGRREVDFSAWMAYPPAKQAKKRREIAEQVREGEMPPWYYILMHLDARLDEADRQRLITWTGETNLTP